VLSVGPGFCWQLYEMRDSNDVVVQGAACYLERRGDGLRGLLRRDAHGWWVADFHGNRMNVPDAVVESVRGTAPYGARLLDEQAELAYNPAHRRRVRGFPSTVPCPDCGATVVVA
jgi:hypothetical protein